MNPTIVFVIIALIAGIALGMFVQSLVGRIKRLEEIARLAEEVAKGKKHCYPTIAGIEDAQAVSLDVLLQTTQFLEFVKARAQKELEILGEVRADPHGYKDQPAGRRPNI